MNVTGKQLFVANKVFAIPKGFILFRENTRGRVLKLPIEKAIHGLHARGGIRGEPVDILSILSKIFCPPTTQVKHINRVMQKTVSHYFQKYSSGQKILNGDIVLSEDGCLFNVIEKKKSGIEDINYVSDMNANTRFLKNENLYKI